MAKKAAKAAKRSRAQQAADQQEPQEQTQQAVPSEVVPVPGEKKVRGLSKELDDFQSQINGLVGAKRERLGHAKEKQGFHTKALADAKRIAKMADSVRHIYLTHLQHYLACLGVTDLSDNPDQAQMFDEQLPSEQDVQQAAAENGDASEETEQQEEQTQHAGTAARFPSAVTH